MDSIYHEGAKQLKYLIMIRTYCGCSKLVTPDVENFELHTKVSYVVTAKPQTTLILDSLSVRGGLE